MTGRIRFVVPVDFSTETEFSLAFPFSAVGEFWEVPLGRFAAEAKAWTAKLSASGDATFTVEKKALGEAYADMVGAGTGPAISGAVEAIDVDITDWDEVEVDADTIIKVTCTVLSVPQVTLTLHFVRT